MPRKFLTDSGIGSPFSLQFSIKIKNIAAEIFFMTNPVIKSSKYTEKDFL